MAFQSPSMVFETALEGHPKVNTEPKVLQLLDLPLA